MAIYYAICAGVSTLSLLIGMILLSAASLELRRTAASVRTLADHADERIQSFKTVGDIVAHFSTSVQSGWMRGAEIAFGLVSAMRQTFAPANRGDRPSEPRDEQP